MDRYLYRGKRVDNGEWIEGHYVHDEEWGKDYIIAPIKGAVYISNQRFKVIPETVGQCTGRVDKNKTLLFDGDTIKTPYNDVYDFAHYQIKWGDSHWYCQCIALHHKEDGYKDISRGGYCNFNLSSVATTDIEIIGNIHTEDTNGSRK